MLPRRAAFPGRIVAAIMSDLTMPTFMDAKVPNDVPPTPDETPPAQFEFACEVCGKELEYSGRGRHPKRCDEHRKNSASTGTRRGIVKNEQLAATAAEALLQINGLLALGLMFAQLPQTAETLNNARDAFREQAYNALLTDPELCKAILRGGTASGKVSLVLAYGMLAASVAPIGWSEYRANKEARRVENDV